MGLQVGHWHIAALPDSLARLRDQTGTAAAGRMELQLNLNVARRTAALLEAAGVQVDLLPATVPDGYRADAFVAIHADGNFARAVRGYKVAPPWRAGVAWADAALTAQIQAAYSTATGLPRDPEVTDNMRGYYAINGWMGTESRISAGTPSAVIETGFMTSAADRAVLFAHPERVAAGVAGGILAFLQSKAGITAEQQRVETVAALAPTGCSAVVLLDDVPIRAAPNPSAAVIAWSIAATSCRTSTARAARGAVHEHRGPAPRRSDGLLSHRPAGGRPARVYQPCDSHRAVAAAVARGCAWPVWPAGRFTRCRFLTSLPYLPTSAAQHATCGRAAPPLRIRGAAAGG